MTSSFSIQDLLADNRTSPKQQESPSNSSHNASPGTRSTPSNTPPPLCSPTNTPPCNSIDATPCSGHLKKSTAPKHQVEHPFPEVIEVTVLEAGLAGSEGRSSRKRCRVGGSMSRSSESEGFQSDRGSLSPTLSSIDSSPDSGNKAKRLRTALTTAQLKSLEHYFHVCPYPDNMGRDVISRVTGIEESKIQVWFQNRRARYRKREKPLQPPTTSLSPLPTSPQLHTLTAPQATHLHTLTAPKATQSHALTAPMVTPSHHFTSAMLEAYYTTLAYQAYCTQSTPSLVRPALPHPGHYPGVPFPYHFLTPSPATQPAFSSYKVAPPRHSTSPLPETD